jgi:pyruvate/2-oxoglutarate dehydrogenase complex dihydrolipoamide dehydrogenase (E3) component
MRKPRRFDRNLVVIGAGSSGLVAAYIGAAVKAKVTLIEQQRMGGDCLNTGCVPSKALIRTAKLVADMKRAHELGLNRVEFELDFAQVMQRIQRVVGTVAPHDSIERYTALGVECLIGKARIVSPWSVQVEDARGKRTLTSRAIVIATGARPLVPPIPGIEKARCVTSDTVWELRKLPKRLAVLGGGPIGCELAQCFARLGSEVTLLEMAPRVLMREDAELAQMVAQRMQADGVRMLTEHKVLRIESGDDGTVLIAQVNGREVRVGCDVLLCAAGRVPNTEGLGLEELGIGTTRQRTIETNAYLQTIHPNILACGDVAGPYQFTHTGSHQAWYAAVNALFGDFKKLKADYSVIPWCTFTDPELARVGLNEEEACEQGIAYETARYSIEDLDRAIADEEARGEVKVLTVPGKDRVIGASICSAHAGELLTEFITAMKNGIGLNRILGTIHIYPTFSEANKMAAGAWKRAHAPQRLLRWVERYHAWRRG